MVQATSGDAYHTVGRLLNEAQRSKAGHKKYAAALWRLITKSIDQTLADLFAKLEHIFLAQANAQLCVHTAFVFAFVFATKD